METDSLPSPTFKITDLGEKTFILNAGLGPVNISAKVTYAGLRTDDDVKSIVGDLLMIALKANILKIDLNEVTCYISYPMQSCSLEPENEKNQHLHQEIKELIGECPPKNGQYLVALCPISEPAPKK